MLQSLICQEDPSIWQVNGDRPRPVLVGSKGSPIGFALGKDREAAKAKVKYDHGGVLSGIDNGHATVAQKEHDLPVESSQVIVFIQQVDIFRKWKQMDRQGAPTGEIATSSIYLGLSNFCGQKKWDIAHTTVKLKKYITFYRSNKRERL